MRTDAPSPSTCGLRVDEYGLVRLSTCSRCSTRSVPLLSFSWLNFKVSSWELNLPRTRLRFAHSPARSAGVYSFGKDQSSGT